MNNQTQQNRQVYDLKQTELLALKAHKNQDTYANHIIFMGGLQKEVLALVHNLVQKLRLKSISNTTTLKSGYQFTVVSLLDLEGFLQFSITYHILPDLGYIAVHIAYFSPTHNC